MTARSVWRWLAALVILASASAAVIGAGADMSAIGVEDRLRDLGVWAPALFVILYAVGTLLFLPGSVLRLAGGALFGPVWGVVINLSGATAGATLAFLTGQYLAGDLVARRSGPRLQRLLAGSRPRGGASSPWCAWSRSSRSTSSTTPLGSQGSRCSRTPPRHSSACSPGPSPTHGPGMPAATSPCTAERPCPGRYLRSGSWPPRRSCRAWSAGCVTLAPPAGSPQTDRGRADPPRIVRRRTGSAAARAHSHDHRPSPRGRCDRELSRPRRTATSDFAGRRR